MVGLTDIELDATGVTAPIPRSIEKEVALVVVHTSVEESPKMMLAGDAESVQVGAAGDGGGGATEIPASQVVCPPGPETVIVKFVVAVT
mgnify:FL=1